MIGGKRAETRAEDRVMTRRVYGELLAEHFALLILEHEGKAHALRTADPVRLHQSDFLRPGFKSVERLEEFLGIIRNLEEPLGKLTLLDEGAGTPTAAVDHLLIGEHRLVDGIPVDHGDLALNEAGLHEIDEHLLFVAIVGRIASGELAAPVDGEAERLELAAHRCDIVIGPGFRMHAALDGGVLGRHAESVPAHRMQHIVA